MSHIGGRRDRAAGMCSCRQASDRSPKRQKQGEAENRVNGETTLGEGGDP